MYMPDGIYKTAKMISQNICTKVKRTVVVWKGKKTRWPIYQRLIDVCIAICNHLIEADRLQLMRYSFTSFYEEIKSSRESAPS
jgi:hypothetical protein